MYALAVYNIHRFALRKSTSQTTFFRVTLQKISSIREFRIGAIYRLEISYISRSRVLLSKSRTPLLLYVLRSDTCSWSAISMSRNPAHLSSVNLTLSQNRLAVYRNKRQIILVTDSFDDVVLLPVTFSAEQYYSVRNLIEDR